MAGAANPLAGAGLTDPPGDRRQHIRLAHRDQEFGGAAECGDDLALGVATTPIAAAYRRTNAVTAKAVKVGTSWFPALSTYPRSMMVPMMVA